MAHHDDTDGVPLYESSPPYPRASKWAMMGNSCPTRSLREMGNDCRSLRTGILTPYQSLRCQILDAPSFIAGLLLDSLAKDDGIAFQPVAQSRIGLLESLFDFSESSRIHSCPGYMERTALAVALIVRPG